jgi:dienelactone hydrolase
MSWCGLLPKHAAQNLVAGQQAFLNLIWARRPRPRHSRVSTPSVESKVIGMETMKRGISVLLCVCALTGAVYFAVSKWGIRHETLNLFDTTRQRAVAVDLAVRRDYEMKAEDGYWKLPVAIISNGNTVKNTEYSFLANVFAARGYLVASIQQDLPTDPPLMTKVGLPYVGRRGVYEKGEANILFVVQQLKKLKPNADYGHLTLVGHSNGGDTAMYFAKHHPELVSKVVTLDNLRVPFVLNNKLKILSFRSKDPNFQTDPGVLPTPQEAKADGIDIVHTQFQHTWMSDRGPDSAKERIQATLDQFLGNGSASDLAPANTDKLIVTNAGAPLP